MKNKKQEITNDNSPWLIVSKLYIKNGIQLTKWNKENGNVQIIKINKLTNEEIVTDTYIPYNNVF